MRFNLFLTLFAIGFLIFPSSSCKKYLDAKPDISLATPTTVASLQGILDNFHIMNTQGSEATEIAADNYYLNDSVYNAMPGDRHRDAYLWKSNIFIGTGNNDWVTEYDVVYNANVVLDNMGAISRNAYNAGAWDNVKGSALFFRGKAFYEIAQVWAKAYDSSSSQKDLGIPLRLTSDFNALSTRSSMAETYNRILEDLYASLPLLPLHPLILYRPSKPAVYGMLSRVYLAMRNYPLAEIYADSCLQMKSDLLDFNGVNTSQIYPFLAMEFSNPEDIFHSSTISTNYDLLYGWADTLLYNSYDSDDLRKQVDYIKDNTGRFFYQGSYDGWANYTGIATDEMFLNRAECEARAGSVSAAMNDLNELLIKRYRTGRFIPLTATSPTEALAKVLTERRKEMVFRMCRFTDIKRLNMEGAGISVVRVIGGQTYTLVPNDPRCALAIPDDVIQYTGMPQN